MTDVLYNTALFLITYSVYTSNASYVYFITILLLGRVSSGNSVSRYEYNLKKYMLCHKNYPIT